MSRIGRIPIQIPPGVEVRIDNPIVSKSWGLRASYIVLCILVSFCNETEM